MAPDPWPDEPEEVDPEARWGNPERDLQKPVRIPEVSMPKVPEETVEGELPRTFWASVLFVNAAVFMLSLGPLLIYFRDQWTLGLGLVAGGLLLLGRTYQLYRSVRNRPETGDDPGANTDIDEDGGNESAVDDTDPERNP